MSQPTHEHTPSGRFSVRVILMSLGAVGLLIGGLLIGVSQWRLHQYADQAIELHARQLRDQAVARRQSERLARYQEIDRRARETRHKWTQVIGQSPSTGDLSSRGRTFSTSQDGRIESESRDSRTVGNPSTDSDNAPETPFWSFRRLRRPPTPVSQDFGWARNPIDAFIGARLQAAGLDPNPSASPRVLSRRLWFDLTGLPPDSLESENDGGWEYDRLVDRLLNQTAFGERWARTWLDLARYADSNGYEEDELRPQAFPYRDFVIWAFNQDLPYDVFVRWQIAGDELDPQNPLAVSATGFCTAAPHNTFMPQEIERYDELDDIVSTLGNAIMGLSVGCARCHDHKHDPILAEEYYGLVAIFRDSRRNQSYLVPDGGQEYGRWANPVETRQQEIEKILKARVKEENIRGLDYFTEAERNLLRQPIDPDNQEQVRLLSLCERCLDLHITNETEPLPQDRARYDQLQAEIAELEPLLPPKPPVGLTLSGSGITTVHVLDGGDLKRKRQQVGPGFLTVLTAGKPQWDEQTWKVWAASRGTHQPARPRTALANWLTDTEGGAGALLARVIVNRLWHHHFGQGLVRTPSDFGTAGDEPTHPELLEWLACELVDAGWRMKHIHRLIVTSATYRQSTESNPTAQRIDPDNSLWWRRPPQRLSAEMLRDAILAAGNNLNRTMYGPGVQLPIPRQAVHHTQEESEDTWPSDIHHDRPAMWRRSVYAMSKRTIPIPLMQLFDAPSASLSCPKRKITTVPTQALALWNSPFVNRQSRRTADEALSSVASTCPAGVSNSEALIDRVYVVTLGRLPSPREAELASSFICPGGGAQDQTMLRENLSALCHVLFMSNEFVYID